MQKFPMELIAAVDCHDTGGTQMLFTVKVTLACLNMRRNGQEQEKQKTDGCGVFGFSPFGEKWMPKRKRFFGRALV